MSGSQRQDQGVVLWVQAPTRTVCQQEALLGEARDTAGSWVLQVGLGVCLSGERGVRALCGWVWRVSGESLDGPDGPHEGA